MAVGTNSLTWDLHHSGGLVYSKSSFIWHTWGIGCADRSILLLQRTVTYDTLFNVGYDEN
jgi:hypothetical protein